MITAIQAVRITLLRTHLNLSDTEFKQRLFQAFKTKSILDLTRKEADNLINALEYKRFSLSFRFKYFIKNILNNGMNLDYIIGRWWWKKDFLTGPWLS